MPNLQKSIDQVFSKFLGYGSSMQTEIRDTQSIPMGLHGKNVGGFFEFIDAFPPTHILPLRMKWAVMQIGESIHHNSPRTI